MNVGSGKNKGFTLVELLTVMAICTALLAIALPVICQARNRARSTKCISNLHQLGGAIILYSQDWGDRLPKLSSNAFAGSCATSDWSEGTSATETRLILGRLANSDRLFRCPNDLGADEYGFANPDKPAFDCTGSSYVPWSGARAGSYGVAINGTCLSSVVNPSSQILLRDYGSDWHGTRMRDGLSVSSMEHTNAVYADGRAAAVQVFVYRSHRGDYAWVVTRSGARGGGTVRLNGLVSSQQVELTGRFDAPSATCLCRVSVSGLVHGAGPAYELDRVFNDADPRDAGMSRVVAWIESLTN